MTQVKEAVCCLIEKDGKFLSVTRKDDHTKWGLPGGKVDPGETSKQAVVREVFEETGLVLHPNLFYSLYTGICPGEVVYSVVGYVSIGIPDFSTLNAEDGLLVGWKTSEELCDPNISPFAEYNKKMFSELANLCYN